MKHLFLLLFSLIICASYAQKIDIKEKITIDNAHLITNFDKNNIESMVTYYFASRIRKDDKWKEVVPNPAEWSSRMKYSIKKHNGWKFLEFKNLGFYEDEYGSYVKVYIAIEFRGKKDGGEDEVELERKDGKWFITKVPI
ncbi:MAG: hypothetical protein AAF611_05900 [Bacteroidota bacterium]